MAGIRKVTRDDHDVVPWKNGGGITRVIATGGSRDGSEDWGWRVSIATVERDGAYSEFPGVDRLTTVVVGNGTDLFHPDGSTIPLNPLQPTLIPSDVALWGILRDEPILNLNVMTRQGQFNSHVDICDGPQEETITMKDDQVLLVHSLVGTCSLQHNDSDPIVAPEGQTLVHEGRDTFTLSLVKGTRVAVVWISFV